MIFLDTSAIYARADIADPNHHIAIRRLQGILDRGEDLLTHNYVLVESIGLLQARLGLAAATKLARDAAAFIVDWVDEELHLPASASSSDPRGATSAWWITSAFS